MARGRLAVWCALVLGGCAFSRPADSSYVYGPAYWATYVGPDGSYLTLRESYFAKSGTTEPVEFRLDWVVGDVGSQFNDCSTDRFWCAEFDTFVLVAPKGGATPMGWTSIDPDRRTRIERKDDGQFQVSSEGKDGVATSAVYVQGRGIVEFDWRPSHPDFGGAGAWRLAGGNRGVFGPWSLAEASAATPP